MRISDWSSDVCSSDLNAVDRERLGDRFLPDIADPFGKLVRHAQLFGREGDLDAAVGDDLIRHVLTITSAKLRAGLDDGQEPNAVARHKGTGARNHRRTPYPHNFVKDDQESKRRMHIR